MGRRKLLIGLVVLGLLALLATLAFCGKASPPPQEVSSPPPPRPGRVLCAPGHYNDCDDDPPGVM